MTMSLPNTDSMKHGPEWLRQMNDLNSEGAHITTPLSAKSSLTKSSVYGRYSRLHDKQYSIDKLISVWAPSIEAPVELKLYEDIFDPGNVPVTPISMKAFIEKEKKQADESTKESIIGNSKTNHNRSARPGNSRGGGTTGNITGSISGSTENNSTSRGSNAFSSSSTSTRGSGTRRGGRWQAGNSLNEEDEPYDIIGNKTNRQAQTAYFRGGRGRAGFRGGSRGGVPGSGSAGHQFVYYDDGSGGIDRNFDEGPAGDESDDDRVGSDSSGGGEWQQVGGTHTRQRQISQNSIESNEIDKLRNKSGGGGGGGINSKSAHINDSSISTIRTNANNVAATSTTVGVSGSTPTGTGNTINWRQRTRSGGDKQPHTTTTSQSNQNSRRLFHPVNSSSTADHQQQQRSPHQRSFSGEHQNFFTRRSRNSSRTDDIVLENFYEEQPTENESVNLTDDIISVATAHHHHHSQQHNNKSATSPVNVDILAAQIKELAATGGFSENELKQVLQRCLSVGSQPSFGNMNNITNATTIQQQPTSLSNIDPAIIANKVKKLQSSHSMEENLHVQHDPTTLVSPAGSGHVMTISWYYLDPKGSMHGPYSNDNMRQWLANGYFTDSLQLRRSCDLQFLPLSVYKDLCKHNNPFLDDLIIPPITTLLSPVVQQQLQQPPQTTSTGPDETVSADFEGRNKHQTTNHSDLFGAPGLRFGSPESYFVPPRTPVATVPSPNIIPNFHSPQHPQQAMNLLVVDKAVLAVSTVAPPLPPTQQQQSISTILSSNHASINNSIVTGTSSSTAVGAGVGSGSGTGAVGLVHSLSVDNSISNNVVSEFLPSMFTSYEPVNSFPSYDVASASRPIWPNVAQANSCYTHHQVTSLNVNATDETLTAIQDMVSNSIWGSNQLETHSSSVEKSTTSSFLSVQQQSATNDTSQQQTLLKQQQHDVIIKKAKVKKSTQKVAVVPVQKKLGDVDEDKQRLWEEAYRLRVEQENQQRLKRMAEEVEQRAMTLAEEQAFEEGERLREWEQIKTVQRIAEERRREDERLAQLPQLPSSAKWAAAVGGGSNNVGSVVIAPASTGSSNNTATSATVVGSNVHVSPPNLLHIQRMEQIQANTSTQSVPQSISSSTSVTSSSYMTGNQQQSSSTKRPDNLRSVWNAVPSVANVVVKASPSTIAAIPLSGTKTLAEIQAEELQREMELKRQQSLEFGLQQQHPQHGGNIKKQQPLLWANKVKQGNTPNLTSPPPPAPTIAANVVVPPTVQSSSSSLLTSPPQQQQQMQPVLSIWGSAPLPASNPIVTTTVPKKATEASRPGDVSQRKAPVGGGVGGGTTISSGKMSKEDKKKNELNTLRHVMKESLPLSPLLQWARGRISELSVSGGAFDVAALIEIASAMPDDDEVTEMFKQYLDDSESVRSFSLEFLERRRELQRTGDRNNEWITATSHRTVTKGGEIKQKEQQQTQSKAMPTATSTKKKKKVSKAANQSVRIQ